MESVWWLAGTSLIFTVSVFYLKVRCMFPVWVNCWFCNGHTRVIHALRNSWHCPHCKQYNGFDQDGGYNKVLEEQYAVNTVGKVYNVLRSPFKDDSIKNGLCDMCNLNQQLKVQQLANFVPVREDDYDREIKQYRELLEKSYHLCFKCEHVLEETLEKQQSELSLPQDSNFRRHVPSKMVSRINLQESKQMIKWISGSFSTFIAVWVALISLCRSGEDCNVISLDAWKEYSILRQGILTSEIFFKELSGLGFLSCYLSNWGKANSVLDGVRLLLWLLLICFAWSALTTLRSAASLVLVLFAFSAKFVFPKSDSKRIKRMGRTEAVGESACHFFESDHGDEKEVVGNPPQKETENNFPLFGKPFSENPLEKCWDLRAKDTKQIFKTNVRTDFDRFSSVKTPTDNETKPSVFCEKINSDMINLNLGAEKEKCRRSANFLFQTRNFADKNKHGLLKPAKFFAGIPNVLPSSEYEESFSANSTPSLYPGGKWFDSKDCYHFTERLPSPRKTCFPVQRGDFLNRFSDYDYQPDSFCRLADSVYTCGMQANFSFPSRNPFVCDAAYPPSLDNDHRLRESVETPPQKSGPLGKSALYAVSLLLNFMTLFFFMYRTWPEFIAYDFKLPNFSFYV